MLLNWFSYTLLGFAEVKTVYVYIFCVYRYPIGGRAFILPVLKHGPRSLTFDPKDGELCLCKTKSGETLMELKCTSSAQRSHKRCWFIQTAGRWPWKSESAKECVTTHLPNELALKMDCALAGYLCSAIHVK
eukprot:maker-scaffold_141-snap-gene-0.2-mRNA-1 protein AED:0.58 eAED:0.58 QI:0/0/0/1/0/0/3/0/131